MNWIAAAVAVVWLALLAAIVDVAMTSTAAYLLVLGVAGSAAWIVWRPLWKP